LGSIRSGRLFRTCLVLTLYPVNFKSKDKGLIVMFEIPEQTRLQLMSQ